MITIERAALDAMMEALRQQGYTLVGPVVRDHAIVCDEIHSPQDLPIGYRDEQDGGSYRLSKTEDETVFGFVVGPQACKKYLFPPRQKLWSATRSRSGFEITDDREDAPAYALFGVRACDLSAILIQDRVFMGDRYVDPVYSARRRKAFIVAVNCGRAGGTCFCTSMGTGPKATGGYDIALTEVVDGERHYFVVDVGSDRGERLMTGIAGGESTDAELAAADAITRNAARQVPRSLDTDDLQALLFRNLEHPQWDVVARRCLSCGNCTLVCPTCFCSDVEDTTDLTGDNAARWRRWDSCFTRDFTYIHGGSVRFSTKSRYRQWMTHKLASWVDQFGTLGCVGCGRCITWCPVGIDITDEVREIRRTDGYGAESEAA